MSMQQARTEERRSIISRVELSWLDATGQTVSHMALMVDRSLSGAGIAVSTPVTAGTRLSIKERSRTLTGTVRYCRPAGREYLIGVQYDEKDPAWSRRPTPEAIPIGP